MVSVLAFNYDDPSLNFAKAYIFVCKINENKQKEAGVRNVPVNKTDNFDLPSGRMSWWSGVVGLLELPLRWTLPARLSERRDVEQELQLQLLPRQRWESVWPDLAKFPYHFGKI